MFSPVPRPGPYSSLAVDAFSATQGVTSARRVSGLPFSTPEEMIAASRSGLPRFDILAMTRSGTLNRARNRGPTSAASTHFFLPHPKVTSQQLIAVIKNMDVTNVRRANITPTAIFDFDNTIIGGDVFHDFVALLVKRTELPQQNAKRVANLLVSVANGKVDARSLAGASTNDIVSRALRMVEDDTLSLSDAFFVVIGSLAGVHETKLSAVAEELFTKGFEGKPPYRTKFFNHGKLGSSAEKLISTLKHKGIEPHIITLGIPTVARAGARHVGIKPENVHGFELEVVGGVCTGRAVDARVIGKHRVAEKLVSTRPLFCFGDSLNSDTPMLSIATVRAFAVDPSQDFRDQIKRTNSDVTPLTYKG